MPRRFVILGVAVGVVVVAAVSPCCLYAAVQGNDQVIANSGDSPRPESLSAGWAEDNVRVVQEKLREAGLYFGEIDGAFSSELAAALGRYQIRHGLPITGELDEDTSKALGTKAAVTTTADDRGGGQRRGGDCAPANKQTPNNARLAPTPGPELSPERVASAQSSPASSDATIQPKRSPLVHR